VHTTVISFNPIHHEDRQGEGIIKESLINSYIKEFGSVLDGPRKVSMAANTLDQCMTTATWSSMYFEMSPRKQAAMMLTPPNAILT
jgi:hypothetical protein